jgi:hypothetical protein
MYVHDSKRSWGLPSFLNGICTLLMLTQINIVPINVGMFRHLLWNSDWKPSGETTESDFLTSVFRTTTSDAHDIGAMLETAIIRVMAIDTDGDQREGYALLRFRFGDRSKNTFKKISAAARNRRKKNLTIMGEICIKFRSETDTLASSNFNAMNRCGLCTHHVNGNELPGHFTWVSDESENGCNAVE